MYAQEDKKYLKCLAVSRKIRTFVHNKNLLHVRSVRRVCQTGNGGIPEGERRLMWGQMPCFSHSVIWK